MPTSEVDEPRRPVITFASWECQIERHRRVVDTVATPHGFSVLSIARTDTAACACQRKGRRVSYSWSTQASCCEEVIDYQKTNEIDIFSDVCMVVGHPVFAPVTWGRRPTVHGPNASRAGRAAASFFRGRSGLEQAGNRLCRLDVGHAPLGLVAGPDREIAWHEWTLRHAGRVCWLVPHRVTSGGG